MRNIGVNMRGRSDPEVYRVCEDVCVIVGKMLAANQAIDVFSRRPRFEFEEALFLLELLGAQARESLEDGCPTADLWISEG